jgi:ankyrin repeat protein
MMRFMIGLLMVVGILVLMVTPLLAGDNETLLSAINANNAEKVKGLINKNPKLINVTLKGMSTDGSHVVEASPVFFAARNGNKAIVEFLIAKGADVNAGRKGDGSTALFATVNAGIGALLISKGANVNARNKEGRTPLHAACQKSHKEMAVLLISKGADVNAKNDRGVTPLGLAKDPAIRKMLIQHGAKEK